MLRQIDLPHSYYYREMYLPQLTSGPSAVTWSPDGQAVIYSMQGSLWRQSVDSGVADQLTAGPGYDYQPDWSPDGASVIFTRYVNDAVELHRLELASLSVHQLTTGGAVNVDPRWSPDGTRVAWVSTSGTGHLHIYIGVLGDTGLSGAPLRPERRSRVARYYYSPFDHELSPSWSPDGSELILVSNPETAYGTGGIWRVALADPETLHPVRIEETTWKTRPDWSPDGKRVIYSSYLGRQWHQLWITTAAGGEPLPLSYGEFDITHARWSPDASCIAYISNAAGNTAIWIQDTLGGGKRKLEVRERRYLHPMGEFDIEIRDENGAVAPARVSITGADGRSYFPDDAWVHASDGFDRRHGDFEAQYFHSDGNSRVTVPAGSGTITIWHGLEHAIVERTFEVKAGERTSVMVELKPLDLPPGWSGWISGDLHVHMNYGGAYRNTPQRLLRQAAAEDLDIVHNLVVNKEQRIPDIGYFSGRPDPASGDRTLLLHDQEFHTSLWGHLGLLGLTDHYLLPDYSAYPYMATASPYPGNSAVADLAHAQNALVGYVHPFDRLPDPATEPVTNSLPVDAALGKVDYYEVVGFSDHHASAAVWYRLLNCGLRIPAGAGTDAMANFASLRGPVGMNRVYAHVESTGADLITRRDDWLRALAAGTTLATNGPLLLLNVEERSAGEELVLEPSQRRVRYSGTLRSIMPVDHLEIVMNGEVVREIQLRGDRRRTDFDGVLDVNADAWILLRAWNDAASPHIFDRYPYATTGPVYVATGKRPAPGRCDADYFIRWIDDIAATAKSSTDYNTDAERQRIVEDIRRARRVFESGAGGDN